jgi:hypothetical protein
MSDNQGRATSSGIEFGPNHNGKSYISIFYHRGNNRPGLKNKWHADVLPPEEYAIFCHADYEDWFDHNNHYWGVHSSGNTVLGCQGERLCKFPKTSNVSDPWHGYPISPLLNGDDDAPSDEFVEKWIVRGVISKTLGRRIQRRKV